MRAQAVARRRRRELRGGGDVAVGDPVGDRAARGAEPVGALLDPLGDVRLQHRAEHGDADREPELARRVVDPRGEPALRRRQHAEVREGRPAGWRARCRRRPPTSPASRCSHDESASTPVISSSPPAHQAHAERERCRSAARARRAARRVSELAKANERERRQPQADLDRAPAGDVEQEQRQVDEDAERARPPAWRRSPSRRGTCGCGTGAGRASGRRRAARRARTPRARRRPPRRARAPARSSTPARCRAAPRRRSGRARATASPRRASRPGSGPGRCDSRTLVSASAIVGSPSTTPSAKIACQPNASTSSAADQRPGREREPDDRAPDPDRAGARRALELLREQRQRGREHRPRRRAPAAPARRSAARTRRPARTAPKRR